MNLWIRSQDKTTLEKVQSLKICENPDGTWFFNSGLILGEYKTKERAFEVLDEIMELLKSEEMLHIRKSSLNTLDEMAEPKYILKPVGQPKVYIMPEE